MVGCLAGWLDGCPVIDHEDNGNNDESLADVDGWVTEYELS